MRCSTAAAARCRAFAKIAAVPVRLGAVGALGHDRQDGRARPSRRDQGQARQFRARALAAPPFGGPELTNLLLNAFEAMEQGPKGDAPAARLSAARPVRHRHRFPRLSRAAAAQLAARGDRDRASADPRLPGSGRRRAAARRPGRAGLSPRGRPRASPAPSRPSGRASSTTASRSAEQRLARPRRLPRPRPAAARRAWARPRRRS